MTASYRLASHIRFLDLISQSRLLEELAKDGNPEAINILGEAAKCSGKCRLARTLFESAARQGHTPSLKALVDYLMSHARDPKTWSEVLKWTEAAAAEGDWWALDRQAVVYSRMRQAEALAEFRAAEFTAAPISKADFHNQLDEFNNSEEHRRAFEACLSAAKAGETDAQLGISERYKTGFGTERNLTESLNWLTRSATAGGQRAQLRLMYGYLRGIDVEQNDDLAFHWTEQVAEQEDPEGKFELGMMYAEGKGVAADWERSLKLLENAAFLGSDRARARPSWIAAYQAQSSGRPLSINELFDLSTNRFGSSLQDFVDQQIETGARSGDAAMQHQFGLMYSLSPMYGFRDEAWRDHAKCIKWLTAAAKKGHAEAQFDLAENLVRPDFNERMHYPCVIKRMLRAVGRNKNPMKWYLAAAEQGHLEAQHMLGKTYTVDEFDYAPNDVEQGMYWFNRAAEDNHMLSIMSLAAILAEGRLMGQDLEQAASWCKVAADQGNADAQFIMGYMHQKGVGVPKNLQGARSYYESSGSIQGALMLVEHFACQELKDRLQQDLRHEDWEEDEFGLGFRFFNGTGIPDDIEEAAIWFLKGATNGRFASQYFMSLTYADEAYSKYDLDTAKHWFEQSAAQGHKGARELLDNWGQITVD